MIRFILVSIIFSFFFNSCKSQEKEKQESINVSTEKRDTIKIAYFDDGKIKEVLLRKFENEAMVNLEFFPNGKIYLKISNVDNYPRFYKQFDENGDLIQSWTEGDVGGCIGKIDQEKFYKNNKIYKEINHSSTDESCSQKILLMEEKEFYPDGKNIKSIKYFQESYEGSDICPCGIHTEFDVKGVTLAEKEFPKCGSDFLSCDE